MKYLFSLFAFTLAACSSAYAETIGAVPVTKTPTALELRLQSRQQELEQTQRILVMLEGSILELKDQIAQNEENTTSPAKNKTGSATLDENPPR